MPPLTSPLRWWRRATQVQRVNAYTDVSLHIVLWAAPVIVIASPAMNLSTENATAASAPVAAFLVHACGVAVQAGLGTWQLHVALRSYPGGWPQRPLAPLLALGAATIALVVFALTGPGVTELRNLALASAGYVATVAISPLLGRPAFAVWTAGVGLASLAAFGDPQVAALHAAGAAFLVFTVRTSLWLRAVVRELDQARGAQAALAVAEERLRFARDLHDVLGRNLSAISVTSELATELSERSDGRATGEMRKARELAHESLREVREIARGYRDTTLESELSGARSLLEAAGISCAIERQDALSAGEQEMAAWVVREAVTNVLRHSNATHCEIRLAERTLVISNDGVAGEHRAAGDRGSGLSGLAERLAPAGAALDAGVDSGAFTVTVEFPRESSRV